MTSGQCRPCAEMCAADSGADIGSTDTGGTGWGHPLSEDRNMNAPDAASAFATCTPGTQTAGDAPDAETCAG